MHKTIQFLLFSTLLCLVSCHFKPETKTHLATYIDSIKVTEALPKDPLIIFDGVPISYKNKKDGFFAVTKDEIRKLEYVKKGETGLYGSKDKYGVVLVVTRRPALKMLDEILTLPFKKIYVLDGKLVSEEFIQKFDKNKIDSVFVVKDQSLIRNYTDSYADQMIQIITKK